MSKDPTVYTLAELYVNNKERPVTRMDLIDFLKSGDHELTGVEYAVTNPNSPTGWRYKTFKGTLDEFVFMLDNAPPFVNMLHITFEDGKLWIEFSDEQCTAAARMSNHEW